MNNFSEILAMSDYASYVWSAVGITVLVLLLLFFSARYRLKKALKAQAQWDKDSLAAFAKKTKTTYN